MAFKWFGEKKAPKKRRNTGDQAVKPLAKAKPEIPVTLPQNVTPIRQIGSAPVAARGRRWYEIEIAEWSELGLPLDGASLYSDESFDAVLGEEDQQKEILIIAAKDKHIWILVTEAHYTRYLRETETVYSLIEGQGNKVLRRRVNASVIQQARTQLRRGESGAKDRDTNPLIDSQALQVFEDIVREGVMRGASDIHISGKEGDSKIKYRIEGHMVTSDRPLLFEESKVMVRAVYNTLPDKGSNSGSMLTFETQQRAAIPMSIVIDGKHEPIKLRFQISPKKGGYHATMRVLFENAKRFAGGESLVADLIRLGFLEDQARRIELATRKTNSGIATAGVTGSGKTVTLYTMLSHMATPDKMTYSVEDPIEGALSGVEQIQVNTTADVDADKAVSEIVKALLRMDPDIALISEIRGRETASGFQELVQTGHQSLTTIHANNGLDIFERMASEQIGIPRHILASPGFFSLLMYQRLLRQLCEHCKIPLLKSGASEAKVGLISRLGIDPAGVFVTNYKGCEHCKGNPVPGVARRSVCSEIVIPNFHLMKLLEEKDSLGAFRYWRRGRAALSSPDTNGKTSYEVAIYKMAQGLIDPSEVESIEPFELYLESEQL